MNKERWTKENCPYPIYQGRKRRPYERTHEPVTKWDDLKEDEKEMLLGVKKIITSYLGDRVVKLFGSRTHGTWIETSDWDIAIIGEVPDREMQIKVQNHDYGYPVDIQFRLSESYLFTESDVTIP